MLRLTPRDPAAIIAGDNATTEQVAQIRSHSASTSRCCSSSSSGRAGCCTGDLGEVFFFKKTVAALIGERIEPTLSLALVHDVLAVCIAVPLGVIAALPARQLARSRRHGLLGARILGAGVRDRLSADLRVRDLARTGCPCRATSASREGVGGWAQRLILPSLTLSVIYIALIARMTRTSVLEVMSRGLHPHRARQGPDRAQGAVPACAAQRGGADRHGHRPRRGAPDRRRRRDRERVHHSRASAGSRSMRCWRATIRRSRPSSCCSRSSTS